MKCLFFVSTFAIIVTSHVVAQTKRDLSKEVEGTYITKNLEEYSTARKAELPSRGVSMYYNVSRVDSTTILITQGVTKFGKESIDTYKAKLSLRNDLIIFDEIWELGNGIASGKFEGERMEEVVKEKSSNKPLRKTISFR